MEPSAGKLTPRLRAVASLVPDGARLADIGTDHAYVPIALAGRIRHAVASDVREGPLARARENVERSGLSALIETRLSDGFSAYRPGEADVAVLAGMGGILIGDLLSRGGAAAASVGVFVLQPMTAVSELRRYLEQNGYRITAERLAREGEKLYTAIRCERGEMKVEREGYYHVGRALFESRDPLLPLLLDRKIATYEKRRDGLRRAALPDAKRLGETERILRELQSLRCETERM